MNARLLLIDMVLNKVVKIMKEMCKDAKKM